MTKPTTDLCDAHEDQLADGRLRVLQPVFQSYGASPAFAGPAATLRCFEDNTLVRTALEEPGQGRVLVVDGGGARRIAPLLPTARILSMRRALSRGGAAALLEARRAAGRRWAGEWFEGAAHEGKGER